MTSVSNSKRTGFTLIELLIVIGILSVLVVTILVTLNPSEAQKKARDTKRMKDLSTLQSIVQQYINDGNAPICKSPENPSGCNSSGAGENVQSQNCASTNWVGVSLCRYSNTVPTDPSNNVQRTYISGGTVASPTTANDNLYYQLKMEGSDYEIRVRQESKGNAGNVINDGGDDTDWAEVGSNLNLL